VEVVLQQRADLLTSPRFALIPIEYYKRKIKHRETRVVLCCA
jgi:hypothetical protein